MPRSGPRQIYRYSKEFRLAAVRLIQVPGMQVKAVAAALGIHPFMLSKWRKDVRDGTLRGRLPRAAPPASSPPPTETPPNTWDAQTADHSEHPSAPAKAPAPSASGQPPPATSGKIAA
jgi:transposase-like protein